MVLIEPIRSFGKIEKGDGRDLERKLGIWNWYLYWFVRKENIGQGDGRFLGEMII